MKYLAFMILFVSGVVNSQDLKEIRVQYPTAVKSSDETSQLAALLLNKNISNSPVLMAYKGAVLTLKAKYSKSKQEKKDNFREGVSIIENAIKADSLNIEIRYIRLTIQENSPKFLGYHKNIEEDKMFIKDNYTNQNEKELKPILKDYVLKSGVFDENEKEAIRNH